jgi:hypothetical protein
MNDVAPILLLVVFVGGFGDGLSQEVEAVEAAAVVFRR